MRYLSVCSGMEAASVAWHPLGWQPVGFSEIEPFPCAILKHRFPNTPNYGDLTQYQQWPLSTGDVDLIAGGPPCQAFSVAGLRRGLADPRGNLTLTYLGLVDKLRPKWVVYENVPGLLSVDGGRAFGSFLGALVELGYGFAYRVLDAQYVGGPRAVPQRRRRVFVVACLGDWRAPAEVLSLREGLRGYLEAGGKKRKGAAADAGSGVEASGLHRTVGTLCADTHPGAYSGQDAYTGRLIPQTVCATGDTTHCLTASQKGATEDGTGRGTPIVIDRAAFNQGVNAQFDPHIAESEVMDSLVARGPHAVGQPIHCSDIAPTVTSSGPPYSRTGNERVEAEALAITVNIYGGNKRKDRPEGGMYVRSEDTSKCLDAANGLNPTCSQGGTAVVGAMAVRRLTPVECERLQGFPDNWSRIPWKGKPETECPDGPRYKACGNSMAVPVMRWIGEHIAAVEASSHA